MNSQSSPTRPTADKLFDFPPLRIRNLVSRFPVIQAGMGVRVGNSTLAAATINAGGFGTIASVGLGDIEKSKTNFVSESNRVLLEEIRKARELSDGKKNLGINAMVALSNYEAIIRQSVEAGIDFIVSGAGLPLSLPEFVGAADIALIPVISGGRALAVLLGAWKKRYNRLPDAVIVEGPKCGGHLGFTYQQLENPDTCSLEILYLDTREVLDRMGGSSVPLIAAGEISSAEDIRKALKIGYSGVQIGTKFIATAESGLDIRSKEVFINAEEKDVVVIKSPVGLPVRVLMTPLVDRVMEGRRERFGCPYRCLRTCNPSKAPFCIAKALLSTWRGDIKNGLFMTGCNISSVDGIISIQDFFDSLK